MTNETSAMLLPEAGNTNSNTIRQLRQDRSAFTLVELLVVLGILVLLLAIATPVAVGTMARGREAQCMGNLRQWGIALNLYLSDHMGHIPYEGWRENPTWTEVRDPRNRNSWFNVLPPYVDQPPLAQFEASQARQLYTRHGYGGILQSPAAKWSGNEASRPGPVFSYAFNSQIYASGMDHNTTVRITNIHGDALTGEGTNQNRRTVGPSTVPMLFTARASLAEPRAVPGMNNDAGTAYAYTRRASARHNGRVAIVFLDGSVRTFEPLEIMDSNGRNIASSPVIWNPWDPDAP
jgi:prepilin-type N-terminal cleavage/methylation domain-containing protein/prepilin-type processing-associated H-X9-DG protein